MFTVIVSGDKVILVADFMSWRRCPESGVVFIRAVSRSGKLTA